MIAHEDALEVVPPADIDLVPADPDEIKALALANQLTGARHRKDVPAYPDRRTDLAANEPTLLDQFARQGSLCGLSNRNAAAGGDPEVSRSRRVAEGFEEQDAVVTIQDDGPDCIPNAWSIGRATIQGLHQLELSGHNPETSG